MAFANRIEGKIFVSSLLRGTLHGLQHWARARTTARLATTLVWKKVGEKRISGHSAVVQQTPNGPKVLCFDSSGKCYALNTSTWSLDELFTPKRRNIFSMFGARGIHINHQSAYVKDNTVFAIGKRPIRKANVLYSIDLSTLRMVFLLRVY